MGLWDWLADVGSTRVPRPPTEMVPDNPDVKIPTRPRLPLPEEEWRRTLKRQWALAASLCEEAADAAVKGNRAEMEALLGAAGQVSSASIKAMERLLRLAEQRQRDEDRAAGKLPMTLEEARTASGIDTAPR